MNYSYVLLKTFQTILKKIIFLPKKYFLTGLPVKLPVKISKIMLKTACFAMPHDASRSGDPNICSNDGESGQF